MLDICLHCGTKFALHQWLQARGFGDNVQDTDPESPTFGDYFYTHDSNLGTFVYWTHPSGVLTKTAAVTDIDGNVTTPATFFTGFFALLRITGDGITQSVQDWVQNSTGLVNQQGFPGYGGEGVTVISPGEVIEYLDTNGIPGWEMLGGNSWSDPRAWIQGPAMTGDVRTFDGQDYTSLVDFNHWSPSLAPQTWELVAVEPPTEDLWPQWQTWTGFNEDLYQVGDQVTHNGQRWIAYTGNNHWEPGVFGWTVQP